MSARCSAKLPELPEMQEIHKPAIHGPAIAPSAAVLTDWRPEDKDVLAVARARAIARRNLLDLDPRAAAVVRGVDGVVGGRRQAAGDRLQLHDRPAVLAGGAARPFRRDAAHLLLLHGADLRRPAVDDARRPGR